MTRREFFERLALAAAAIAVDPERLLWTPKPMIVVPALPTTVGVALAAGPDVTTVTICEWAKRVDRNGNIEGIVELLGETNAMLEDMLRAQGRPLEVWKLQR